MEILLWGVRGSIASPTQGTQFYGTNTSCIEVRTADDTLLVFDAGSGLRLLGETLPPSGECHIFISHGHADHIQGLGFFTPLNNPLWTTHIHVPERLWHFPESYFNSSTFPVSFADLKGRIIRHEVKENGVVEIAGKGGPVRVTSFPTNHPGGNTAYRVEADGAVFFYSGDHEITEEPALRDATKAMLAGADVAVVDAPYSRETLRRGWGHSAWEDWVELGREAGVDCLVLSHHEPGRTDKDMDALQRFLLQEEVPGGGRAYVAREGMRLTPPGQPPFTPEASDWLDVFLSDLAQYEDESVILDRILAKTREVTHADAGTVFLAEGNELVFAYTHNDTFFPVDSAYKYAYVNMRIPLSRESIAGYAGSAGVILNLPDVRTLPPDVPYHFDGGFDARTGYVTHSMLTIPFFGRNKELLGVLQLLNSLNPRTKEPQAFSAEMENSVKTLAREAAKFLEFGAILRQSIYRLLHITAIHDPRETGPHAERVGAITAELYQRWAEKAGETPEHTRYVKSQLRLAAMLHDIGKVGISDLILKKPGTLTEEEFAVMRTHTVMGGELLISAAKDITELAHGIALHHHQKWDGSGYAGSGPEGRLAGEDIPLPARLTALADVFDALVSPRCYKEPWSFEDALEYVRLVAGRHFDPVVVACFMEILDIVHMIYERFPDAESPKGAALHPVA